MSTIKEVAELAGVSIGTVSHVIGGSVPVSDSLRRKVLAAIRTLDYHPNHIARSLKTRKTLHARHSRAGHDHPFFSANDSQRGNRGARAWVFGYRREFGRQPARQKEVLSLLRSQRVEGILLVIASGQGSQAQVPKLIESGIPVVCLGPAPGRHRSRFGVRGGFRGGRDGRFAPFIAGAPEDCDPDRAAHSAQRTRAAAWL